MPDVSHSLGYLLTFGRSELDWIPFIVFQNTQCYSFVTDTHPLLSLKGIISFFKVGSYLNILAKILKEV